jgi:hypothetical protein
MNAISKYDKTIKHAITQMVITAQCFTQDAWNKLLFVGYSQGYQPLYMHWHARYWWHCTRSFQDLFEQTLYVGVEV